MALKFTFSNLGPIKKAEMELGNLTVIAGENNTGKTYLTYAVYGLLRWLEAFTSFLESPLYRYREESAGERHGRFVSSELLNQATKDLRAKNECRIPIPDKKAVMARMSTYFRQASREFSRRGIRETIHAVGDELGDVSVECGVARFPQEWRVLKYEAGYSRLIRKSSQKPATITAKFDQDAVIISLNECEERERMLNARWVDSILQSYILSAGVPHPFIFPAERFGISLFYKELDLFKNQLVDELQKLSKKDRLKTDRDKDRFYRLVDTAARYASPIRDCINYVRGLEFAASKDSDFPGLTKIICQMMGGKYRIQRNGDIRFVSTARGKNRFDIPLHMASSSARGLSALFFYLTNSAKKGELLMIDEPESHISPQNQVVFARLLARLVNAGMRVFVTTHSDYIVREFNNLIMLGGDFSRKKSFLQKHKKDYSADDFLDPDSVRGYVCEKGALTACDVDRFGISMPPFDDAIEKTSKISIELDSGLRADGDDA